MMLDVGFSYICHSDCGIPYYSMFAESLYFEWLLNFVMCFFCILRWSKGFLLYSFNMVRSIHWFSVSLVFQDRPYLIMIYYLLKIYYGVWFAGINIFLRLTFLDYLIEFASEIIWAWSFLFGKVLIQFL